MAVVVACLLSGCVLGKTRDPHVVTDDSAELTGTLVSSSADQADYWFEYGPTSDYGSDTIHTGINVVNRPPSSVSATVGGLTAGSTYHYRLCWRVVNASLPPAACDSDRTVTTGVGRVSVTGTGRIDQDAYPELIESEYSVDAAADAPEPGYVDGTVTEDYKEYFVPQSQLILEIDSTGTVECLRVAGNVAVVGYSDQQFGSQLLVIEDNGATGDLFTVKPAPASPCPTPSSSLLGPTPTSGDFTIQGGS